MRRPIKLCIISGGGIFGCLPIHFLSMLPSNQQNLEKISVIGGTSVGSILACGLATGKTFGEIDTVFRQLRHRNLRNHLTYQISLKGIIIHKDHGVHTDI